MPDTDLGTVRIVSMVPIEKPNGYPNGRYLAITIAVGEGAAQSLTLTRYVNRDKIADENIIPLVRNWFHRICADVAEATQDWKLPDDEAKRTSGG